MSSLTISDIHGAAKRIAPYAVRTPLLYSPYLSETIGTKVYLKCENLQLTGSFKLRGALNMVLQIALGQEQSISGVITASSGNHGQAVAYSARSVGIPCTVVVPQTVSTVKEQAILGYGANVVHEGTMSNERIARAKQLAEQDNLLFIPPYDDFRIMAGQGTVGLEILEQCEDVSTVVVPVGGGGLLSGIAAAVKSVKPSVMVIGAEPEAANDTFLSMQSGRIEEIDTAITIADGLRTSHPGELTFPVVQRFVDGIQTVSEVSIRQAVKDVLMHAKLLLEPSGAVSVAALKGIGHREGSIVCVLSGGNVDLGVLQEWLF